MIDFLIPPSYVQYDLAAPNTRENAGGGIAVKYARCVEAADRFWGARRIGDIHDVESNIVLVDWSWFVLENNNPLQRAKAFLSLDVPVKILYGSDLSILKAHHDLRRLVIEGAHNKNGINAITHNTQYQRRMYHCIGISNSFLLADPIPEKVFTPAEKRRRLNCMGQIAWYKRSTLVRDLFYLLEDTDIETCYIGGANLWGNVTPATEDIETHEEIQELADIFVENASTLDTAYYVNSSMFYAHLSLHDVSNQAGQENLMAGNPGYGLTHPVLKERPFQTFQSIEDIAEALVNLDESQCTKHAEKARQFALKNYSYKAWEEQLAHLLHQVRHRYV